MRHCLNVERVLCKKNPEDFVVKYRQLAVWTFTVNFTGACRMFAGITSYDGVRLGKLKLCAVVHIPSVSYFTNLALLCPDMLDYSCK